jgi:hypothetical protein
MPRREGEKNMSHDRLLTMILLLRHHGNWVKERQDRPTRALEKTWNVAYA